MKKEETLILGREDMFETQQGKNILLIDFTDFKISVNKILENGIIVFIDNNGDTKILKNRFGDIGMEKNKQEEEQIMDTMCQQLQMEVNASETQKYYKIKEVQDLDNPTDVVDEYESMGNLEQTPAFLQGAGIRWVAVTDALPKIASENYLVVKNGIVSISLFRGDWNEFQCDLNDFQKVTHWSECPKPPCL